MSRVTINDVEQTIKELEDELQETIITVVRARKALQEAESTRDRLTNAISAWRGVHKQLTSPQPA